MTLSTLLLLPLLAYATPLGRRACTVEVPTYIGWIDSASPDFNSNPLADNILTLATKEPGRTVDTLVEFTIPQGSWGCQLELFFQQDYNSLFDYGGPTTVDVWNVNGPIPLGPNNYSVTWNLAPQTTNLFGTSGQIELPPRYGYRQDVKKVINSASCQNKMTYRVKVPDNVARGGVQFYQRPSPFGGWRIVHNC